MKVRLMLECRFICEALGTSTGCFQLLFFTPTKSSYVAIPLLRLTIDFQHSSSLKQAKELYSSYVFSMVYSAI